MESTHSIQSFEQLKRHASDAAHLMSALSNECGLMILCTLAKAEMSVGALNQQIELSQSALLQQLARLRRDGLVTTRRQSQSIFYSLRAGPAERVIQLLRDIYCPT